jgi:hypothetical protein
MNIRKYLQSIEDMSNRKIVLTGATSGIGKELLFHLLSKNAYVILLVHSTSHIEPLKEEIYHRYKNAQIDIIEYDQASFKNIETSIDELNKKHPDYDTVVLNAGVLTGKGRTKDNYPLTIGVNYLGVRHFIEYLSTTTNRKLKIVIQGSIVAYANVSKKSDLNKQYGLFKQYNLSKGYLEAYFYYLYSKNITRSFIKPIRFLGKYFLMIFFHSPKKASLPLLKGVSDSTHNGDYITPRGLFTLSGYPKVKEFPNRRKREYLFK